MQIQNSKWVEEMWDCRTSIMNNIIRDLNVKQRDHNQLRFKKKSTVYWC